MATLRDLAEQLEECLKKNCPEKSVNETPPISPENKKKGVSYEPDSFANRILAIHNEERAAARPLTSLEQAARNGCGRLRARPRPHPRASPRAARRTRH